MPPRGYADPEVKDTYVRARELGHQVGQPSRAFSALRGLWMVHEMRGELHTARELGEQLLSMTSSLPDPASLIEVHRACGNTLFWLGEFGLAREHLEHAIALYQPDTHRSLAFRYGSDPKVVCLFYNALTLWALGYPDQASAPVPGSPGRRPRPPPQPRRRPQLAGHVAPDAGRPVGQQ